MGKDYTNLVTVTNTSSETLVARAVITVGDVSYVPESRTISPGRTAIYDVDQMRKQQVKDVNGKTIPLGPDYGKFMWFDSSFGSKKGLMGRNSVTSTQDHRKSSFSCGMDCGFTFDKKPVFDTSPFGFGPYGSSWGGSIVWRTILSNGQEVTDPYPFSSSQLASSDSSILNYSGDQSFYTATTGLSGEVLASYYEYDQQEAYDEFGDCTPLMTEEGVSGSAGTSPACATPDGETSSFVRQTIADPSVTPTASDFIQTLTTVGNDDGNQVREQNNETGADACWFNLSAYSPMTGVSGGLWTIAGITPGSAESQVVTPGHNQWGPDLVGYAPGPVRYYQQQRAQLGLPIPCGFTVHQNLSIKCTQDQVETTYKANIPVTSTIDATGLTNCREGVCAPHYNYQ